MILGLGKKNTRELANSTYQGVARSYLNVPDKLIRKKVINNNLIILRRGK